VFRYLSGKNGGDETLGRSPSSLFDTGALSHLFQSHLSGRAPESFSLLQDKSRFSCLSALSFSESQVKGISFSVALLTRIVYCVAGQEQ
jgi:hypothetical protein